MRLARHILTPSARLGRHRSAWLLAAIATTARGFGLAYYLLSTSLTATAETPPSAPPVDFVRDIKPILAAHCYDCHGARKQKADLRLDNRSDAFNAGGPDGKVIVPGRSGQSSLFKRVTAPDPDDRMPQKAEPLSAVEIARLKDWIDRGAVWPAGVDDAAPTNSVGLGMVITAKDRTFWSFQPVRRVAPPAVKHAAWVTSPVDAFILAKLESEGLAPAPPASKRELIRRVTFDLTGLPPTPDELAAFLNDRSPHAYEKVVDRLLDSSAYGERWGQHWLDVVRYAETEGFEYDNPTPDSWRFRDFVIRALNEDLPFDRFVTAQLAGDEIAPDDREMQTAAGFHRLGAVRRNAGNQAVTGSRNEILTERTDIIGSAFLGLTLGCARCHDHKFDPIRQRDYYQMQAFLASSQERDVPLVSTNEYAAWKTRADVVNREIERLKTSLKGAQGEEEQRVRDRIKAAEGRLPAPLPSLASVWDDPKGPTPIHILQRGDWEKRGERVGMRGVAVLLPDSAPELPGDTAHPRALLAKWLTSPEHPLTARVFVNRVWQFHFGQGIVKTPNDFGANGSRPSHPELLDYLAGEFVAHGWRLKPLHRALVLSSAYRQSSRSPLERVAKAKDPENRLLWRFNRQRLEAEELRDAMLTVAGRLNRKAGGPSVQLPVDKDLVDQLYKPSQWVVTPDVTEHDRRSVYLIAKRNLRLPFMQVFDQPMSLTSCPRRESSTHAPQALELLNGRIANELAAAFAERLRREGGENPRRQVELAYRLALGRDPARVERDLAMEFLKRQPLKEFALAVFNLNAFIYVD